jgi:hypothetical protein
MFFFFHLFAGIILGLLIADLLHDRRWVIPFVIGSLLPDLIDKPFGYILFGDIIGSGRTYAHGLLFFIILLIAGILLWKYRSHPAGLALAAGILLHQILDLIWQDPKVWYYPLAGPLKTRSVEDYAFVLLKTDISARSEWIIVALMGVGFIVYLLWQRKQTPIPANGNKYPAILAVAILFFSSLSVIAIGLGIFYSKKMLKPFTPYVGWSRPEEYILAGIIFAIAAYYVWRHYASLKKSREAEGK